MLRIFKLFAETMPTEKREKIEKRKSSRDDHVPQLLLASVTIFLPPYYDRKPAQSCVRIHPLHWRGILGTQTRSSRQQLLYLSMHLPHDLELDQERLQIQFIWGMIWLYCCNWILFCSSQRLWAVKLLCQRRIFRVVWDIRRVSYGQRCCKIPNQKQLWSTLSKVKGRLLSILAFTISPFES